MDNQELKSQIIDIVQRHEGIGKTKIENLLHNSSMTNSPSKRAVRNAVKELVKDGKIVMKKVGKRKQLYPQLCDVSKLAGEIDDFIKDLDKMKNECSTYPYDMSNSILHIIRRHKDELNDTKSYHEHELRGDVVSDIQAAYGEYIEKISSFMRKMYPRRRQQVCSALRMMSQEAQSCESKCLELKLKRKNKQYKGTDSLDKEIEDLTAQRDQLLGGISAVYYLLKRLKGETSADFKNPLISLQYPEIEKLEYAKFHKKQLQDDIMYIRNKVSKRQTDQGNSSVSVQNLETGLEEMFENIEEYLEEMSGKLNDWHKSAVLSRGEQDLYDIIQEHSNDSIYSTLLKQSGLDTV